jgi:hypothetical protein
MIFMGGRFLRAVLQGRYGWHQATIPPVYPHDTRQNANQARDEQQAFIGSACCVEPAAGYFCVFVYILKWNQVMIKHRLLSA